LSLVDDTGVYMVFKTGTYTGFGNWDSITWSVRKLRRSAREFETVWTFESDWKPEPLALTAWESVFLPAISGNDIFVPGLGGTVFRVNRETGQPQGRVNPFTDTTQTDTSPEASRHAGRRRLITCSLGDPAAIERGSSA
jgi:hypothetical protein